MKSRRLFWSQNADTLSAVAHAPAADASNAAAAPASSPKSAPKKPLVRGAFNREVAQEIQETLEIVSAAREPFFAAILQGDYEVLPATITQIETKALEAKEKYGLAAGTSHSGMADTAAKQKLEDDMDAAIRRIQTGARLSFPDSAEDQRRFGIGIRLETAEDQVELLVPQILKQLETETLRSVKPLHIQTLKDTFDAWMAAGGAQSQTKSVSQSDRAGGLVLLKEIRPLVREIKISIDGEFPYNAHSTPDLDIKTTRQKFHLPPAKPFVSTPHED